MGDSLSVPVCLSVWQGCYYVAQAGLDLGVPALVFQVAQFTGVYYHTQLFFL